MMLGRGVLRSEPNTREAKHGSRVAMGPSGRRVLVGMILVAFEMTVLSWF